MLRNYFKSAWRNLARHKTNTYLNIIGLSAGLTAFALIALWVNDELSYDKFNSNADRIVRLTCLTKTPAGESMAAVSSAPMAQALMKDYAEVENAVRVDMREEVVQFKGEQILQPGILLTDPSFFDIFSYKLLRGDVKTALKEPFSLILTESTAKKYFGGHDPIGETLLINMLDSTGNGAIYTITGIIQDPPTNAHFTFNMLGSFKTVETVNPDVLTVDGWGDASYYTYLLLKKGVDQRAFSNKITQFYASYIGERYAAWKPVYFYSVQPLLDIHLRSNIQYEIAPTGSIEHVYIFATIGIFILLLAGINYMNLSIARSVNRAKEVSVKKVFGAARGQLVLQYVIEAVLTAVLSLFISLLLASLLQPMFFQLTGKELSVMQFPLLIIFLAVVTVALGVAAGIYPALAIAAFQPVKALKGVFKTGNEGVLLRKLLVGAQFTITLVLVTSIIIINSQMSFIRHKDVGFDKDVLLSLSVNGNSDVIAKYEAFKNELLSNPLIKGAATSNSVPVGGLGTGGSETVNANNEPLQINTARLRVDEEYLDVYGIELMAGKNFSPTAFSDTINQVMINEKAVKKIGWKNAADAIGKPFRIGGRPGIIVGVVNDFHFNSLQLAIDPLAIYPRAQRFSRITVRADLSNPAATLDWISLVWKKHFPSALLDYDFMDKQIGEQYQAEQRFSAIFLYFSVLSLLIACLGLFGLIAYAAMQKTKEIGIRKVLGASVQRIVMLLSKDFLKLVVIAFFIAAPVAWYFMNEWLLHFAYRTNISWWMFAAAGALVLLIALCTLATQAIKAATANPIKSLRAE
ncbi:MAG TPA: ABC transporter permease [Chitinophagaceae bacterium]|nr:ABC transporter permease [Chitinophagaceae bacterium]